ncbi:hypothetical protein AJ79_02322 [Helicocarpus griseus UAMH5409]|uniref:Epoxide hydrolase N-terminal domain-containing protein n=1 Tax=Helicocarpus griseus UAMH5409 TaxID=1447875 RepID=A0A2B7Y2Q0_9EURO|nr:hypothetical protein AJ79_02322 [Helicocarpus griseus UAMH5409]
MPPRPYTISVPQPQIDRLQQKLALADLPDELDGAGWDLGTPLAEVSRLVKVWQSWDWREAEKRLNEACTQYETEVEVEGFGSLNVHFVHERSKAAVDGEKAIPLLFVHGWPGSFVEVLKILPLLTQCNDSNNSDSPSFHIVAPSLPNYGFSQGVSKRGFGLAQYAETCHKLMLQLGYDQYVTQAGDWGYWITRAIGKLYPESCRASHYNMVFTNAPSIWRNPLLALWDKVMPYSESDRRALDRKGKFEREGKGYNILQSTKSQSLAYALHDSPTALLAWLYEKLHDWSDTYPWTDDEILTWVSIYAFSRAGPGAAHRIYYEVTHAEDASDEHDVTTTRRNSRGKLIRCTYEGMLEYTEGVKIGLTYNPKELETVPVRWGGTLGEVVDVVENEIGGHFYAHEHPELLVRDLRRMFGRGGGAFAVIPGKDGY